MGMGSILVIAVCVVLLIGLFVARGQSALKGDVPKPLAGALVVVFVLVVGLVLYRATSPTRQPAAEGPEGSAMMMGGEGGMNSMGADASGNGVRARGGANPHRDLGRLVRKLAVLQTQEGQALSEEQTQALVPLLKELQAAQAMTAEEAETHSKRIEGVLTDMQLSALESIELPRRPRGGGESGGEGARPSAGATEGGEGAGGGTRRQDWRAAMRARFLEVPYVKELYDQKAAEDPDFATNEEKQNEFFRGLRGQLSPFLRGSSEEALQQLLDDLSSSETPD